MVAQKPQGISQGLPLDNEQIARRLGEVAKLLEAYVVLGDRDTFQATIAPTACMDSFGGRVARYVVVLGGRPWLACCHLWLPWYFGPGPSLGGKTSPT
jgi:hypothetical protein